MYRAGQESMRRRTSQRFWPAVSAVLAVVSFALGTALITTNRRSPADLRLADKPQRGSVAEPAGVVRDEESPAEVLPPATSPTYAAGTAGQSGWWGSLEDRFGAREIMLGALDESASSAPAASGRPPLPVMRYGDWPRLVRDQDVDQRPQEAGEMFPSVWTNLLFPRGS
jgi:hypothetical protein